MPKTIILAIFTLLLAAATLVTDFVSPYRGGADLAVTATSPVQARVPGPAPVRQVRDMEHMQARNFLIFDPV
jgi:hypothetical protein